MGLQSSQALAALGYVLYAQKKVPESIDTLKKALDIEPKENPDALNSLGFIYAEEKIDLVKAVMCCRQAVEIAPRMPHTWTPSDGRTRQNNYLEARTNFRRALDLAPGNKEIATHMRLCLEALKEVSSP